jgi:hypothetical protein
MTDIPVHLMAPVTNMGEFRTRTRQVQEYLEGCAVVVAHWANSIVGEAPVIKECQTSAVAMATVLRTLPPQVGEVLTITLSAQKELWQYFVDGPGASDPNKSKWTNS